MPYDNIVHRTQPTTTKGPPPASLTLGSGRWTVSVLMTDASLFSRPLDDPGGGVSPVALPNWSLCFPSSSTAKSFRAVSRENNEFFHLGDGRTHETNDHSHMIMMRAHSFARLAFAHSRTTHTHFTHRNTYATIQRPTTTCKGFPLRRSGPTSERAAGTPPES